MGRKNHAKPVAQKPSSVKAQLDGLTSPANRQRRQVRVSTKSFEQENIRPGTIDRRKMVSDSRDAEENNLFVQAIVKRLEALVIGAGNKLQLSTGDKKADKAVEDFYESWALSGADGRGRETKYDIDRNILRRWYVDGDLGVHIDVDASLFCYEADQMLTPSDISDRLKPGWLCIDGVVVDGRLKPQSYIVNAAANYPSAMKDCIEFNPAFFVHVQRCHRFRQTRGLSEIYASLPLLNDLKQYMESELMASKAAAKWALKVIKKDADLKADLNAGKDDVSVSTTPAAEESSGESSASSTAQADAPEKVFYERLEDVADGAIEYLEPGEDVQSISMTRPNAAFGDFIRSAIRIFGASHNIPLELVLLDFHEANFFGNRAALMACWTHISALQEWFGRTVLTPIAKIVLATAERNGEIILPQGWRSGISWTFPELWEIDRGKAESAKRQALDNGSTTRRDEAAKAGRDWEEDIAESEQEGRAMIDKDVRLEAYEIEARRKARLPEKTTATNEVGNA